MAQNKCTSCGQPVEPQIVLIETPGPPGPPGPPGIDGVDPNGHYPGVTVGKAEKLGNLTENSITTTFATKIALKEALALKADLVEGKVPTDQLPDVDAGEY